MLAAHPGAAVRLRYELWLPVDTTSYEPTEGLSNFSLQSTSKERHGPQAVVPVDVQRDRCPVLGRTWLSL